MSPFVLRLRHSLKQKKFVPFPNQGDFLPPARLFLSAAKPSDLGTLVVVLVVVVVVAVVGNHFWYLPMHSFSEVRSKVARFFISSQNPSKTVERCVQELPDF